ncbi:hypothetical protein [Fredinandcohnia quinoae]|uniref:Uncharacterized protein n=1 Tax=Fredinandcohnia quinoae TaxID=2918902 RepID=A0AAW5E3X6_9BACI|nr:hypothetical protein [Fredinandcohnia sp. SECRCQ15]MCH1624265.1 hypothetical protein [Fredinandcohnia sp. SECRCQ15]
MVRTGAAAFLSIILLVVESFIIMKLKGYTSIYFDNINLLIGVLAMNFFFAFSILTNMKMWFEKHSDEEAEVKIEKQD